MLPDSTILTELITATMPYGKYKGVVLCSIPVNYLEWYAAKGFPKGRLGMQLATLYEIKINGLEHILQGLTRMG